jgi:hypothetical protein
MKTKREKFEKAVVISTKQLIDIFVNEDKQSTFKGCQFAHIVYFTDESGSRTVNKQKALQKLVRTCITVGSSYQDRINRDLEKRGEEGNFTSQSQSGQTPINKYVSQSDKSQKYNLKAVVEYFNTPDTIYYENNKVRHFKDNLDKINSDLFMPSYFTPSTTSGRGNMSEEKDFSFFTVGFDKIYSLRIKGILYKVEK